MEFIHISQAQMHLRHHQAKIEEMLAHFHQLRQVRGSGIKDASCCAVALQGSSPVYGNSQAYGLDADAADLGRAHAEVVAYELAEARGQDPRLLFCELSPCPACAERFADLSGRIIYLFAYPSELDAWKDFHRKTDLEQIAFVRSAAGLD